MLRGRAGAHLLVPPTDPVGRTPLIEEEDAVPLVRHVLRSQANTSGFAETKPLTQPVFESKSDQKSRSLNMTCKEVEVRGFLHGFDKSSRVGRRGRNVTFSNVCKDRCVFLRHLRRNIIPALLQTLLIAGPSVEVGVWKGDYSSVILNGWRGTQSHTLVDPYKHFPCPPNGLRDKQCTLSQYVFDEVYANVSRRMEISYGERVHMFRDVSVKAAQETPNTSLGFAYIDARHDYDAVLEDVEAWWPKVRPGGIIAGHDFTHLPLARAVVKFLRIHARTAKIYVTADHPASWIVAKC